MFVSDWMTRNPKTCSPETTLFEAQDMMMEGNFRRLPVTVGTALLGIVTHRDIRGLLLPPDVPAQLKERYNLLRVRRVKDVMTKAPTTVRPDTPLERAAAILGENKFGGLPVMEGDSLAGIICQKDVMAGLMTAIGAHRNSFRFTFEIFPQKGPALSQFLSVIESQGATILSVLSGADPGVGAEGQRCTVRVTHAEREKLLPYLEEVGVRVDEVVQGGRAD